MMAKNYQTDVVLYERIGPVVAGEEPKLKNKSFSIRVNEPLKHDHYALYQVDFKLDELKVCRFISPIRKRANRLAQLQLI